MTPVWKLNQTYVLISMKFWCHFWYETENHQDSALDRPIDLKYIYHFGIANADKTVKWVLSHNAAYLLAIYMIRRE